MSGWISSCVLAAHMALMPLGGPADACAFHFYKPEKTAIDWVIETDHLVLARNSPADLFSYQVVETLQDGGRIVEISDLVDSGTRRMLATHPDDSVLFAYDPILGEWRRVAYVTLAYRSVIDDVRSAMGSWNGAYDATRLEIFEALQDHPDQTLRSLALQEIDRAPYELLRTITLKIPVEQLLADLWSTQGYPYQPIRILLLGLSNDDRARAEIREAVDRAVDRQWFGNLGAFSTALLEIDRIDGVDRIDREFLTDLQQPLDKLEQVIEALAIHNGVAAADMSMAIAAALDRLLRARPEAAPLIARQFSSRSDWSQATSLQGVVENRQLTNSADLLTVAVYVAQARGAGAFPESAAIDG